MGTPTESLAVEAPERNRESRAKHNPRGIFEKVPGSGIWWVRWSDAGGRMHREKAGLRSVAQKLYTLRKAAVLAQRKMPETLRRAIVTFAELAADALEYGKAHKRTWRNDRYRMVRLLGWWRERAADSITPQEIEQRLREAAEQDGWKPATVNRIKALVSLTFRLGLERGKVSVNPARLVRSLPTDNARIRFLSVEEETRLRAAIARRWPQHLPEFEIALHCGLRRSEQYGLTWENVDLGRRVLTIPRSKNGRTRFVPLNSIAVGAFETLRASQVNPIGPVFLQANGEPLTGPRKWFDGVVREAKLDGFSWHCLRHTFASRLAMAGTDLRTLAELGGWRTLQMVMRYAHLAPSHTLAAVERLAQPLPACATGTTTGPVVSSAGTVVN